MNKISLLFCGIAFSSVILTSNSKKGSDRAIANTSQESTLALVANGEDFVRQGFTSKDGWQISFDRVYVNIAQAIAYSTESGFEPRKGDTKKSINYQQKIDFLGEAKTADLAAGDATAEPILIEQIKVPQGFYNALSWTLDTAGSDSAIAGQTIALIGTAKKAGTTINFNLGFNQPTEYVCGEFIGDERKGIVAADSSGEVEATFHFDHIFGDADSPLEDALNQDALGFEPIANLASNNNIDTNDVELANKLSNGDYQKLNKAIANLGHVGEGHCVITNR